MLGAMRLVGVLAAAAVFAIVACTDNPSVDGSKVAASASTCQGVCTRLIALCGYAPEGTVDEAGTQTIGDCTDADGGGYCDTQMDGYLDCFASAPSCQDAWNCFNTVTPPDDDASQE